MKVNDDNYYVIQAWMATKLELKGLEKEIFAIIFGFSQDGEHSFHGSLNYLSQLTGYSRNSICDALSALTNLHYLEKTSQTINNVKKCSYIVNAEIIDTHDRPKNLDARPKNLDASPQKTTEKRPKNLDVYIKDIKDNNKKEYKKDIRPSQKLITTNSSNNTVQEFVDMYNGICKDNPDTELSTVRVLTDKRKTAVLRILKKYKKDNIVIVLDKVSNSDFLLGKTGGTWHVNFDWIFKEANFIKILEGNYDGKARTKSKIKDLPCNRKVRSVAVDKDEEAEVRRILEERGGPIEY